MLKEMKYIQFLKNINFFFFTLLFFSFLKLCKLIENLKHPQSITLLNGNIFIVHDDGIDIYDSSLKYKKNILNKTELDTGENNNIVIYKFSALDYGYIISIIKGKIYIFDYEGSFLFKNETKINNINCPQCIFVLIPVKGNEKELSFMLGYIDNNNKNINLFFYKYDGSSIILIKMIEPFNIKYGGENGEIEEKMLTCQLMSNNSEINIIVCFFPLKISDVIKYITQIFINPENYEVINSTESIYLNYSSLNFGKTVKSMRSTIDFNKKKSLVCFYLDNISGYCSIYSIENNTFSNINDYYIECRSNYNEFNLYNMLETDQFILMCVTDNNNVTILLFDKNFYCLNKTSDTYQDANKGISIIYSYNMSSYYLISHSNNINNNTIELSYFGKVNSTHDPTNNISYYIDISNLNEQMNEAISTSFLPQTIINIDQIDIKKEDLKDELPTIINKIKIGEVYKKIGEDYSILIYPTNSTYLTSLTHINFSECENILRKHYHIHNSSFITFLQIELENDDSKSLINQVEYQAYDQNKKLLDLSLCKDVDIQVFYSIRNNTFLDLPSINSFKESGVDIFNINDSFFNDICHPYSESDNDVILEDRIKYIYQNYSLCEEGCTYNEIDLENMTISCNCSVKDNISTVISSLNFEEVEGSSTNFDVIKCYNLVFSLSGKLNNIGFWIFSILILAHFPFLIFYFSKGIKPVKDYILKEMKKYGYIKNDNKMMNDDNTNNLKVKKIKKYKRKIKRKEGNTLIKKNTNSAIASPPKNINKETNNNFHNKNGKSFTIENMKIINNTSSINVLKTSNRNIISNINKTIKNNENSINDNENKFMDYLSRKKSNKIFNDSTRPNRYKTKTLTNLQTQAYPKIENEGNESQEKDAKNKNLNNFALINIDLNLSRHKKHIPPESNIILNNYTFSEARKYDLRQLCVIFYIFALSKQIFFHTFLYRSPLELFPLRLCLFIFMFSCDLALNALFYFNNNISKKYRYAKNVFLFAFSDNITIIILSIFVGFILLTSLAKLSNSTNKIREIFKNEEEKLKKDNQYKVTEKRKQEILFEIEEILRKYKIKIIILIIIELILVVFFWYFVTAFCHVYQETQKSWLLDSLISILIRAIIELLISLGLAKLYRISVDAEIYCLYKFVMFLYNFG